MARHRRPYRHGYGRALFWIAGCVLFVAYRLFVQQADFATPERLEEGIHEVDRVVDGDTLLLTSGARVRLQGIDTPETVKENHPIEPWGPEASQFSKDFIQRAHGQVRLTFGLERKDRYGRFLAFVWHEDRMLNEELVLAGFAHDRLKRRFARAQDQAQKAKRGIWSEGL